MTTFTIQVPEKAKGKLSAVVKELGGEIIAIAPDKETSNKTKLLNEIKAGLKEVKSIRSGEASSYSMSDLFGGK